MSPRETEPLGGLHPTLAYHVVNTLGWTTLRPLQRDAIGPVLRGDDALLLAPTAGGKTEAAACSQQRKGHRPQTSGYHFSDT